MDNGNYTRMRIEPLIISTSLDMYFEGLSLRKIQRQLRVLFQVDVNHTSIWNWLQKYGEITKAYVDTLKLDTSDKWHVDETCVPCDGVNKWLWEIIDSESRFLIAAVLADDRGIGSAIRVFREAKRKAMEKPKEVIADGLRAYPEGFNKTLWDKEHTTRLVSGVGIRAIRTNNLVERVHGTFKDRLRPMRGLGAIKTTSHIIDGWYVYYNFIRKHQTIKEVPTKLAGINLGLAENGWNRLIELATKHVTLFHPLPGQTKITSYI